MHRAILATIDLSTILFRVFFLLYIVLDLFECGLVVCDAIWLGEALGKMHTLYAYISSHTNLLST